MDLLKRQLLNASFISFTIIFSLANTQATESWQVTKGVITMEESILRVDTGSAYETVESIKLINIETGVVNSINGCATNKCAVNLNFLPKAKYRLEVITNYNTKSLMITIN